MSISNSRLNSDRRRSTNRRQAHSLKSDRAITAARQAGLELPSYRHRDIYAALNLAGIFWNRAAQQWQVGRHD